MLLRFDFGQLIAPGGPGREVPVVVPTHFLYDGAALIELHLARPNPVWRALAERPVALFTVVADYVYVPAAVNAAPGRTRRSGCRPATTRRCRPRSTSRWSTTPTPRPTC